MLCRVTSTKRPRSGVILTEWLISVAISSMVLGAVAAISVFGSRSFSILGSYVDMDEQTRITIDRVSQEIRGADKLISYATNQLIFLVGGTNQVAFQYVPAAKTLVRKFNGVQTDLFLKQCDCLRFDIYQNDGTNATFEALCPATTNNCKVVQVNWRLSRGLAGVAASTEDFQSARIVMRKQGS